MYMVLKDGEIIQLIREGEGQRVEFKREPTEKIGEEICAMANAEGGYIFVGVEDDKTHVGTDVERAKRIITSQAAAITPHVSIDFQITEIAGRAILVVIVPRSDKLHTIGGRAFIRIGTSKRPLDITEITDKMSEQAIIPADATPTDVPEEEAWEAAVERFREAAMRRGAEIEDVGKYLEKIGAIKGGKLTLAAALIFLKHPQERWPHTYVRIVSGDAWRRIDGPLWEMADEVYREIMEHVPKAEVYGGAKRYDVPALPPEAVREAVVNALVHRNYANFSEVFVDINGEKISIKNPGSFPPGVSPEAPRPKPRNPNIYELMYQMGYVERRGRGVELIRKACREKGVDVAINTEEGFTEVVFWLPTGIDEDVEKVVKILESGPKPAKEVAEILGVSRVTAIKALKKAIAAKVVRRMGRGPSTVYELVR